VHNFKNIIIIIYFIFSSFLFASSADLLSIKLQMNKQTLSTSQINVLVKNNSSTAIKVLKWNTILESKINDNLFEVKLNGEKVQYLGRKVKRPLPKESDYINLFAGEEKHITIDLSKYYKMDKKGTYSINYKGNFKFSLKESKFFKKGNFKQIFKNLKIRSKSVELSYTPKSSTTADSDIQAKVAPDYTLCDTSERNIINNAHDEAIRISQIASNDINNALNPTSAPRYSQWFGSANSSRQSVVKNNFFKIYDALENKQVRFSCDCNENWYAFVYPSEPYTIYLCNAYWSANATGTDSQAGTLVHEMSHFTVVAGTDDYVYGQTEAKNLAISNPSQAINNADNHEYFAENTPYLAMDAVVNYTLSGFVTNSSSNSAISSALLTLTGNGVNQTTTSSSDGSYQFYNLSSGSYALSSSAAGYTAVTKNFDIALNNKIVNFSLIPTVTADDYKIVLTWGAQPADLDAKLWLASASSDTCIQPEIYGNDDSNSYGPETITFTDLPTSGNHEFWVENYSKSPEISSSEALVKIYKGSTLLRTISIPASPVNSNYYWHVFNIDEAGNINTINSIQSTENPTCRKNSSSTAHLPAVYYLLF